MIVDETKAKPMQTSIHPRSRKLHDRLRRMAAAQERYDNATKAERVGMFRPTNRPSGG